MTVSVSVTVTQVDEDGSRGPGWTGSWRRRWPGRSSSSRRCSPGRRGTPAGLDHGEREKEIAESGRELQRRLLEATFAIDSAREERVGQVTSAAGIRHGSVEKGHDRGVASVFGPVRAVRLAYRNRREPNLYPADARWMLPDDPYSMGMRALAAYHLAGGGYGQAQEIIEARTGVTVGRAQLAGLAADLAAWADDFYEERARDAGRRPAGGDVLMMQADGKGIALRPEHRKAQQGLTPRIPGSRRWPRSSRSPTSPPPSASREDIAAPPARRKAHPGPDARGKWVSASITDDIPAMIGTAFDEADRRDPHRTRQRVFLVDGNKQQITAISDHAKARGLKVPILIDFIHVSGYLGKAAAALHPGDPTAAGQWADGQQLRVLHGRAKAVAATLASVAAKTRANPRTRHLDLTDMDKAVTYLTNNHEHMRYDKALDERLADRHRHDRGSLPVRHRRQIRNHRREMVSRRRRGHPQAPRRRRQRRPRRLHELLQETLPGRTPPGPLRPRQHPRPRPHRMTETPGNNTPLRKTHPPPA